MLRELFKKQIVITDVTQEGIQFTTRLALHKSELAEGAISEVLADTTEYQFSASDKIFFMPGCTVPRFKVKQLCEATGMSVGKTPDNATVIIKGDNTEQEIVQQEYISEYITAEECLDWIEKNYPVGNLGTLSIKQELSKDDTFDLVVLYSHSSKTAIRTGAASTSYRWVKQTVNSVSSHIYIWISEDKKLRDFDKILDTMKPIVYQNNLLAIINSSNVMTEEMYHEAVKMFESQDTNNHVLAMELMANCDYQKSAIYLLLLLKNHSSEIYNRKEKDHVNFRSLCSFFDVDAGSSLTLDEVIETCTRVNAIGTEELPILMKLVKEDMSDDLSSTFFRVKDIEPNDDLTEAIERADRIRQAKLASQTAAPVTEKAETNE